MIFGKGKTVETEIQSAVARGLRARGIERRTRELCKMVEIPYMWIVVMVTCLCKTVKIHRAIHIKRVNFAIYKLYLNQLKNFLQGWIENISLTKVGTLEHVGFFLALKFCMHVYSTKVSPFTLFPEYLLILLAVSGEPDFPLESFP